jgi:rhodanese-related sulfurtransferase
VQLRLLAEDRLFELQEAMHELRATQYEWVGESHDELLRKAKSGEVVVIDVRPNNEFEVGHLPYALSMPLSELKDRLSQLPKDRAIVAYCRGPFCLMSADAVKLLRSEGFEALQLRDGVAEWL